MLAGLGHGRVAGGVVASSAVSSPIGARGTAACRPSDLRPSPTPGRRCRTSNSRQVLRSRTSLLPGRARHQRALDVRRRRTALATISATSWGGHRVGGDDRRQRRGQPRRGGLDDRHVQLHRVPSAAAALEGRRHPRDAVRPRARPAASCPRRRWIISAPAHPSGVPRLMLVRPDLELHLAGPAGSGGPPRPRLAHPAGAASAPPAGQVAVPGQHHADAQRLAGQRRVQLSQLGRMTARARRRGSAPPAAPPAPAGRPARSRTGPRR